MAISRRQLLATAAAALPLSACNTATQSVSQSEARTYVLVHGAWHGGWCWKYVAAGLAAQGHQVLTPTLSGLAEQAHLLSADISLETHIDDVLQAITASNLERLTLVGHSYGGMVVTGVADRIGPQVDELVYLDAAVPKDGESMIAVGPNKTAEQIEAIRGALSGLSADGGVSMKVPSADAFGIPAEHPLRLWVQSQLTPHPLRTWLEPIRLQQSGTPSYRRTYVHCVAPMLTGSSNIHFAKHAQNDPGWRFAELATGHDAMVTAPDDVVRVLTAPAY